MPTKFQLDGCVVANKRLTTNYFMLTLSFQQALPTILPGQFVEVRIDETPEVFLRRPISIHDVRIESHEMDLLIQEVGKGTSWLAKRAEGDSLNVIFPLGNSFTIAQKTEQPYLLVGGGVGIAPLLYLGRMLRLHNCQVKYLLGFRTKADILPLNAFEEVGEVLITTEDGSKGEKGFVTNHSVWKKAKFDRICSCGPTPMMKAVAAIAKEKGIPCEVSLENKMACGLGACLCCVTQTTSGHKCVCTDGPVFDITELSW